MITLYYVIYDSTETAPTDSEIASGLSWAPALAAGNDPIGLGSGNQEFDPVEGLATGLYRIAAVAYDDEELEYSNVIVSDPYEVPDPSRRAFTIFYPAYSAPNGVPLNEGGFTVVLMNLNEPARFIGEYTGVSLTDGIAVIYDDSAVTQADADNSESFVCHLKNANREGVVVANIQAHPA